MGFGCLSQRFPKLCPNRGVGIAKRNQLMQTVEKNCPKSMRSMPNLDDTKPGQHDHGWIEIQMVLDALALARPFAMGFAVHGKTRKTNCNGGMGVVNCREKTKLRMYKNWAKWRHGWPQWNVQQMSGGRASPGTKWPSKSKTKSQMGQTIAAGDRKTHVNLASWKMM